VRRAGDRFFLGASTDETGRTIEQPLTFLKPGVHYTATVYRDAADAHWQSNPTAYEITRHSVTAEDTMTLRLAPGGGAAITFLPE
jgi:alpha-glucosidase